MNLPIRALAVFAVGLVCLESCLASSAGNSAQGGSPPLAPGVEASAGISPESPPPPSMTEVVMVPGPLRPLLRMAGISQDITPAEVLPMLARNVSLWGYENDKAN